MKKYKTIKDEETDLLRIIALRDFGSVKKGDNETNKQDSV